MSTPTHNTYVISDLHGYPHDKFLVLLEKAGFGSGDFLYVLGDVIDRNGDGGITTLRWLMEQPNAQLILGNHEAMLLSCRFLFEEITDDNVDRLTAEHLQFLATYLYNGGRVTINSLKALTPEERQDIFDYLLEAPLYEALSAGGRDYLLVHAGFNHFSADKKLSEYDPDDLIWTRTELDDRYFEDITTVFGHAPTMGYGEEYRGRIIRTDTWINIDVGAAYGEEAVLLRLDDLEEFRL